MSPVTAVGFLLCAIILTLLNRQKRQVYTTLTYALILLLALLGIGMGVLMNDVPPSHVHLASISLFTAIIFLLLAEMSGMEMFRHIRSINSRISTIFITGYDQDEVQLDKDEQASTVILSKPIPIPILSHHIESMLKQ